MELSSVVRLIAQASPKIRTTLHLSGYVVGLCFALYVYIGRNGDVIALLCAGGVGLGIIIFGQFFSHLGSFKEAHRPVVFLLSLLITATLIFALTLIALQRSEEPSMGVNGGGLANVISASASLITSAHAQDGNLPVDPNCMKNVIGNVNVGRSGEFTLPHMGDRDVVYKFSINRGVPTLSAQMGYLDLSRGNQFPSADFHGTVSWGSPWLSLSIANTRNDPLFFHNLRADLEGITEIDDVIINIPEIERARPPSIEVKILNEGWGRATTPKLWIIYARTIDSSRLQTLGCEQVPINTFDDETAVRLGKAIPNVKWWDHDKEYQSTPNCPSNGRLQLIGRMQYIDDGGKSREETFRTTAYECGSGGGGIGTSVVYNIDLPINPTAYPATFPVSNCIASKSADQLKLQLTTSRSARFKLKATLESTSGVELAREFEVTILVPRHERQIRSLTRNFIESSKTLGCS